MQAETNSSIPVAIYQSADGSIATEVRLEGETVWLTQKQMAELFDKNVPNINEHISNIYSEGELEAAATIRKFRIVRQEGSRQVEREIEHYNLDVIISVGYRVKSRQGTQFRIWANRVLKDYLVQGYALNQQRLEAQQEKLAELRRDRAVVRIDPQQGSVSHRSEGILAILENAQSHCVARCGLTITSAWRTRRPMPRRNPGHLRRGGEQIRLWREPEGLGGLFGSESRTIPSGARWRDLPTFDGKELYPSIEEKACQPAVLHRHGLLVSPTDNKRIAAAIFVWFMGGGFPV